MIRGGGARIGPAEALALGAGLAVFGYVAWDGALWDPRFGLLLHLIAISALVGLVAMGVRGFALPRTRIDLPLLLLIAVFGIATVGALNPGLALRAMAAIVATAAMLPVALMLLRHRPSWTALVVTVPMLGLAGGALAVMLWRRLAWYLAGGPGLLPPVRMAAEGTPFGSVAVAPFVLLAALPLTLFIDSARVRTVVRVGLLSVGIPLTLLSGSRSAWLAIGVAGLVLVTPLVRRLRLPERWTPRTIAVVLAGLAAFSISALFVAPRFTAVGSLVYRSYLWRDTLAAVSVDPLLGIGPGTMPYARQAAAPALSFPVQQPHSHNLPLGVLGDAGVVGLIAAAVLVIAFVVVAGPWRTRSLAGRSAFAVLAGFAVAGLFEDLTFLPGFNLLVILLAAMALTDAGAVTWRRRVATRLALVPLAIVAAGLLLGMVTGDAAAIAYRMGTDAAARSAWSASSFWLERSMALDPWHPSTPKALAVAADAAGDPGLAREAAERAVALNAGDGASWTNLALLCAAAGDDECAERAAAAAVRTARLGGRELINAARVLDGIGLTGAADGAYRYSLLTNQYTSLATEWPRSVSVGNASALEIDPTASELNRLLARRSAGEPVADGEYTSPAVRALAYGMAGDRDGAQNALDAAIEAAPTSVLTWDVAALLQRHWGQDPSRAQAVGEVLRGRPVATKPPTVPRLIYDIASFRAFPRDGLVSAAEHLLPETPWPWVLEPLLQ